MMKNGFTVRKNINRIVRKDWQQNIKESVIKQYLNRSTFPFAMEM